MLARLAQALYGAIRWLVVAPAGPRTPLERQLQEARSEIARLDDAMQHERLERKSLLLEVEDHLDKAGKRYAKARAAEARANGVEGNGGAVEGEDRGTMLARLRREMGLV